MRYEDGRAHPIHAAVVLREGPAQDRHRDAHLGVQHAGPGARSADPGRHGGRGRETVRALGLGRQH